MATNNNRPSDESGTGDMSVRQAGHLGGEKGGPKVRRLVKEGEQLEQERQEEQ